MKQPSKESTNCRFKGNDFPLGLPNDYFQYVKFPKKKSVATEAFAFSRFKKQTPKSSS